MEPQSPTWQPRFGIYRTTLIAHLEREGVPHRNGIVTKNIDEAIRLYTE
jgi:hypothetical protein